MTGINRGVWSYLSAVATVVACSSSSTTSPDASAPSELVAGPLGGGVHLTWKDNAKDEESFEIERKESSGSYALLDSIPFNSVLYHDADVSLGIKYSYRVRAKRPSSYTAYSNEASVDLANGSGGGGNAGGGNTSAGSGNAGAPPSGAGTGGGSASGGAPSGGSASGGASAGMGGAAPAVSFKKDVAPVLVKTCGSTTAGCHAADQAVGRSMPQFGPCKTIWYAAVDAPAGAIYPSGVNMGQSTGCPDLSFYQRLTELHSMLCEQPTWQQRPVYVVPGDLDKSLLYQVIAGDPSFGGICKNMNQTVRRMPVNDTDILPNGVKLTQPEIDQIKNWILQGAKNN